MRPPPLISLRETVSAQIGTFLYNERFPAEAFVFEGILEIVNLVADYHEEGKILFPEIIIINEKSLLETVPDLTIELGEVESSTEAFKKIIKDCAPLCTSEWVIYIKAVNGKLHYGLTCAQITETTPSLYKQTIGGKVEGMEEYSVVYLRNIGTKTVELAGVRSRILISLSLNDPSEVSNDEVNQLAKAICYEIKDDIKTVSINYFDKILSEGLKEGHGNLIAVVDDTHEAIKKVKTELPDGTYPPNSINIIDLLRAFEAEKSGENSVALRHYSSVIKSMINSDGLTVFTNSGKLIGYHIIVRKDYLNEAMKKGINGGARTHTFFNLKESKIFQFGFIKSQDGPVKIFSTNE